MIAMVDADAVTSRAMPALGRALLCAGLIVASVLIASAQETQGQNKGAAESPPANVFGAIGRWFDDTLSSIGSGFSSARSTVGSFGDEAGAAAKATANATANVAKDAAGAVARLPGARVVKGHQTCVTAPNGAPDCISAANALCKAKGFGSGKSVDITSAEECPAPVLMGRREAKPGECRPVTFVTSAFCQ